MSEVRFGGLKVLSDRDAWREANRVGPFEMSSVTALVAESPALYDLALLCVRLNDMRMDAERKMAVARSAREPKVAEPPPEPTPAYVPVHRDLLPEDPELVRVKGELAEARVTIRNLEAANSRLLSDLIATKAELDDLRRQQHVRAT